MMRHTWTFMATLTVAAIVATLAVAPAHAQPLRDPSAPMLRASVGYGTIRGSVRDGAGAALEGVLVSALGVTSAVAVTDAAGHFSFGNLPPGPYLIRAHLSGFVASERELVQVRPNNLLVRTFALRRLGQPEVLAAGLTGAQQPETSVAGPEDDDHSHTTMAWRLRHLKRSALRDTGELVVADVELADEPTSPWAPAAWLGWAVGSSVRLASALGDVPFSGELNLLTSSSFNGSQDLFSASRLPRGVAYLSLGAPAGSGHWTVRAALSGGEVASWIVAGAYVGRAQGNHTLDVGMSYGAQEYERSSLPTVAALADNNRNVGAVYGFDSWTVSPGLEIDYGTRWARYDYIDRENMFSPRLGVSVSPGRRTYIRAVVSQAMLAPGAEEFLTPPAAGLWLPPERTFAGLASEPFRAERVRHVEVAVEREFDHSYTIGVRRYFQQSDDQLITLFGVAGDDPGHYLVASGGAVDADGWGVRFSSPLAGRLRGSFDYSLTRARWAPSPGMEAMSELAPSASRLETEAFHDVTTSVEAAIPETATRVSVIYKLNSAYARGNGEAPTSGLDGRFDVRVHQALPVHLVHSEWEALIAVRNMFREPQAGASVYDELLVVRPPTRVVGGVLVRF